MHFCKTNVSYHIPETVRLTVLQKSGNFSARQVGLNSKIFEMAKSPHLSNDQIQALKEISFHSQILKFKEENIDYKNLQAHRLFSHKAPLIRDLIYSG